MLIVSSVLSSLPHQVSNKPVRVNRHVLDRQNWEKFGDCKGLPRGPEQNITYQSFEIIHLDLRPKKREEEKEESSLDKLSGTSSIVVCRNWSEHTPQNAPHLIPALSLVNLLFPF